MKFLYQSFKRYLLAAIAEGNWQKTTFKYFAFLVAAFAINLFSLLSEQALIVVLLLSVFGVYFLLFSLRRTSPLSLLYRPSEKLEKLFCFGAVSRRGISLFIVAAIGLVTVLDALIVCWLFAKLAEMLPGFSFSSSPNSFTVILLCLLFAHCSIEAPDAFLARSFLASWIARTSKTPAKVLLAAVFAVLFFVLFLSLVSVIVALLISHTEIAAGILVILNLAMLSMIGWRAHNLEFVFTTAVTQRPVKSMPKKLFNLRAFFCRQGDCRLQRRSSVFWGLFLQGVSLRQKRVLRRFMLFVAAAAAFFTLLLYLPSSALTSVFLLNFFRVLIIVIFAGTLFALMELLFIPAVERFIWYSSNAEELSDRVSYLYSRGVQYGTLLRVPLITGLLLCLPAVFASLAFEYIGFDVLKDLWVLFPSQIWEYHSPTIEAEQFYSGFSNNSLDVFFLIPWCAYHLLGSNTMILKLPPLPAVKVYRFSILAVLLIWWQMLFPMQREYSALIVFATGIVMPALLWLWAFVLSGSEAGHNRTILSFGTLQENTNLSPTAGRLLLKLLILLVLLCAVFQIFKKGEGSLHENVYLEGEEAYKDGNYHQAIEHYSTALIIPGFKKSPFGSVDIYAARAEAKFELKDYYGTLSDLSSAINSSSEADLGKPALIFAVEVDRKTKLLLKRAGVRLWLKDYRRALQDVADAKKNFPLIVKDSWGLPMLGEVWFREESPPRVVLPECRIFWDKEKQQLKLVGKRCNQQQENLDVDH